MAGNRDLLAKEIVKRFVASISGTDEEQIVQYNPNDRIYVGKLSPQSESDTFSSNVLIKQISVDFRIKKEDINAAELEIYPQGNFFYRVLPTYEQQKKYYYADFAATFTDSGILDFDGLLKRYIDKELTKEMSTHKVSLLPIYEKIAIDRNDRYIKLRLADIYKEKYACGSSSENEAFQQDINDFVEELCEEAKTREGIIPCQYRDKVTLDDLKSEEAWKKYNDKQVAREEFNMFLKFNFKISVEIKGTAKSIDVTVALSNETQFGDESAGFDQTSAKQDAYRINTLFNSGLKIHCIGTEFVPIELDYFADDYKYDPRVYALGNNCNVDYDSEKMEIQTNHVPVYIQKRLKTNDSLAVKFDELISDPVAILNSIYKKMMDELKRWKNDFVNRANNNELTDLGKRQFSNEISNFEIEIKRFKTGVDLIEKYNMIRSAFVYMNRAFKACAKGYESWRLFQIVFIVSLILDVSAYEPSLMLDDEIKSKAKTDDIDILYFPTGGGKTEAFLGILVFNLFFDRLRGKEYGVTALLKYPLRLLSVQQVQRVSNILAKAENIRVEEGLEGDSFSLGYFVGEGNTPNKIEDKLEKAIIEMSQDELDDKYRLMDVCPFCGKESLHVVYDEEKKALRHICDTEGCNSGGQLPLFMVDDDIYRSIPSTAFRKFE